MYIISNCSIAILLGICYIVSTIIGLISFNWSFPVLILLAVVLFADISLYKIKDRKCYLSAIASAAAIVVHLMRADTNITIGKNALIGIFLLALNIVIAFSYYSEHTLGNTPIFQDPIYGKQAGKIACILQASSSIVIFHAMIYVGSLPYIVISFTLLTLLTILFTQLIISPQYKEHKQKEKDELIAQIKKEQGYR